MAENHPHFNSRDRIAKFYLSKSGSRFHWQNMAPERMKQIFKEIHSGCCQDVQEEIENVLEQL